MIAQLFTRFELTDLIQKWSSQLVPLVSQLVKLRSPEFSECVSSDCSIKMSVEAPATD